jgi:hypothetical protein
MCMINRRLAAVSVAGAVVAVAAAPAAHAQLRQYRVHDLTELDANPPMRPFGINADGAVVGQLDTGTALHASVWFPAPLYGFDPRVTYDLNTLASGTPAGDSVAYDINKTLLSGYPGAQIAGQAGGDEGDAFVWTLVNGTAAALNLSDFTDGSGDDIHEIIGTRTAWAISNANPAVVVGDALHLVDCYEEEVEAELAFLATLDAPIGLQKLQPYGGDRFSFARDVNGAAQPRVVGYSDESSPIFECAGTGGCDEERDAVRWEASALPAPLARIVPGWGSQALGVNEAGDIVGSAIAPAVNPNTCIPNATLWRAPDQELVILGDQYPLTASSETIANAINNNSELQIVGRNAFAGRALLWEEKASSGWEDVLDLDDAACDCNDEFILREAVDINDDGWIVARSATRAYLLRRVEACPADLDGDGCVGVLDFQLLLAHWTQPGQTCGDCENEDLCVPG